MRANAALDSEFVEGRTETLSLAWNRENGTVRRDTNNRPTYWSSASHTYPIHKTNELAKTKPYYRTIRYCAYHWRVGLKQPLSIKPFDTWLARALPLCIIRVHHNLF
jgi:hypothetical protein